MDNQKIKGLKSKSKIKEAVVQIINEPSNYMGQGENGWTITEQIMVDDEASAAVLNALVGANVDGTQMSRGMIQFDKPIRLKVLTRQACVCDKDGKIINSADKVFACDPFLDGAPESDTEPQEGDVVLVKLGLRDEFNTKQPHEIKKFERIHEHEERPWRNGMRNNYKEYSVDADGCINCVPADAIQLLSKYGEKLVFPKFAAENSNGRGRKQRKITNWRFREVPPDYKKPQPTNNSANKR
jgi:hypothetical protein